MVKAEIKNLYKIFGPNPKKILAMCKTGMTKEEILKKTGHVYSVNNTNFQFKKC